MTKICPHCKASNANTNTFCYTCGKDINGIKPTYGKYKPPKNPKLKGNFISRCWSKQSQNNKYGYGILAFILSLFLVSFIILAAVSLTAKPEVTSSVANTPPSPSQTSPAVNSTPSQSEEDSYKQWLKEDYKRWDNPQVQDSSAAMYQLYIDAQGKKPPAKYYEFHQHYIKDYYYLYLAQKAAETGTADDTVYYSELANAEYTKMLEYMPDYMEMVSS